MNSDNQDNQLVIANIQQEQLNWMCEQLQKLNDMFMEHILRLTNIIIEQHSDKNKDKDKDKDNIDEIINKVKNEIENEIENKKVNEDLRKIVSKLKNENTFLNNEIKTLKNKLSKYKDEPIRPIPQELITLLHNNHNTEPRACKSIIYKGQCENPKCPFWHNIPEAYNWNIQFDHIRRNYREKEQQRQQFKRPRENEHRFFK